MKDMKEFLDLVSKYLKAENNNDTKMEIFQDKDQFFIEIKSKDDLLIIPANDLRKHVKALKHAKAA